MVRLDAHVILRVPMPPHPDPTSFAARATDLRALARVGRLLPLIRPGARWSPARLVARNARRFPNELALAFEDRRYTWADVDRSVNRYAQAFRSVGVTQGDVVVLMMDNRPEFLFAVSGLSRLRAVGESMALYEREIRNDRTYLGRLDALPAGERSAVLTENYQDLLEALSENRGGEYASFEAACDQFVPFLRWLKVHVIEDPVGYLGSHGVFHVRERDLEEWSALFVDAFSDEDHVREALERLEPAAAQAVYRQLGPAARRVIQEQGDRVFPAVEAKRQTLRALLFELRDRIAIDPAAWLQEMRGRE